MTFPPLSKPLSKKHISFLNAFTTSCRHSILSMVTNAQSGHPGGSLGCIDYLSLLYAGILGKTGEPIIVSNGHVSPSVYAVLAEMGYISKTDVIKHFRKIGHPYEGHVSRHVPGVCYGTGPLGAGISAASGFALAEKLRGSKKTVYGLIGDGESQEGQVYEMMNFASKYKLDNFVVFMDYNQVQLTDSLQKIMPIQPKTQWKAAGWEVIEVNGHNFAAMWKALGKAHNMKGKPVLLLGKTIMGKGVDFMEKTGKVYTSDWHGKAPSVEQADKALEELTIGRLDNLAIGNFRKTLKWKPKKNSFPPVGSTVSVKVGRPRLYKPDELTDCRTAYGKALLDLAKANNNIVALTADVAGSVKTQYVKDELPKQHIECGIAEQQMVSCSGGLSFNGMIPFCSTFGAFMTSRAKDQARVNDINHANVKMVATHCGLSVGEDGPTHQAIDDIGSFQGFFNTQIMEPADPNHCDRMIRYAASHYGNMYVRMGRHKLPVLTKEGGQPFYGADHKYEYGKCDVLRKGSKITIAAAGPTVVEALKAAEQFRKGTVEIVIVSSPKQFSKELFISIKKTRKLITVEDHNPHSGFSAHLLTQLAEKRVAPKEIKRLAVNEYQLSGTSAELYKAAGIDSSAIKKAITVLM